MASMRAKAMWAAVILSSGCASVPAPAVYVGEEDRGAPIPGVVTCGSPEAEVRLDPAKPLVLVVPDHGDSGDRYVGLAYRFELDGRQTACFAYDARASLDESAGHLARALEGLQARLTPGRITLVGHGLGGLVARRALVAERSAPLRPGGFTYTLVTVAAPLGGIRGSADCGRTWLHVLTLGASAAVCGLVAGGAWEEVPPRSRFIRAPGTLLPAVTEALAVITEERGACRRRTMLGDCDEPDDVYTLGEQRNAAVEADPRWERAQVTVGHAEIVGDPGTPPLKLIGVLQTRGILPPPPRVARP